MKRHVYSPLVGRGCSHWTASISVFVFSGVLHELLVGVPTHNILGESALYKLFIPRRCQGRIMSELQLVRN